MTTTARTLTLAEAASVLELGAARVATAEEQARGAQLSLVQAQERVVALEARIASWEAQPVGLFRRRRSVATA